MKILYPCILHTAKYFSLLSDNSRETQERLDKGVNETVKFDTENR